LLGPVEHPLRVGGCVALGVGWEWWLGLYAGVVGCGHGGRVLGLAGFLAGWVGGVGLLWGGGVLGVASLARGGLFGVVVVVGSLSFEVWLVVGVGPVVGRGAGWPVCRWRAMRCFLRARCGRRLEVEGVAGRWPVVVVGRWLRLFAAVAGCALLRAGMLCVAGVPCWVRWGALAVGSWRRGCLSARVRGVWVAPSSACRSARGSDRWLVVAPPLVRGWLFVSRFVCRFAVGLMAWRLALDAARRLWGLRSAGLWGGRGCGGGGGSGPWVGRCRAGWWVPPAGPGGRLGRSRPAVP